MIYNTEYLYNLAFHKPIKDQCDLCEVYQNSSSEEKAEIQEEYDRHMSIQINQEPKQLTQILLKLALI